MKSCLLLFLIVSFAASAQTISFETAVQEMLQKNFDIRIAENERAIADKLNNVGNAGFLPELDASFQYEKSISNTRQQLADGSERGGNNAESDLLNASLLLNWVLFDGFRMFAAKNILESNETLSEYYLRAASEEGIALLASVYYNIVRQQKLLTVYRESIIVSRERYRLAQSRMEIGTASRQEVIQAFIDMNADSSQILRQQAEIANLKTEMNLLLARNIIDALETDTLIPLDTSLLLNEMMASAQNENIDLLIARENVNLSQFRINENRSYLYPQAGVFAGYEYSKSASEAGFFRTNRNYGPAVGVFANWNLFNGLRDFKNVQVSKLEQASARISAEQATDMNIARLIQAYRDYEVAREILNLEEQNVNQAQDNLDIALRKFDLGAITSVEFRDIQLQMVQAQDRLLNAQYEIRTNEIELKRLAGTLRF